MEAAFTSRVCSVFAMLGSRRSKTLTLGRRCMSPYAANGSHISGSSPGRAPTDRMKSIRRFSDPRHGKTSIPRSSSICAPIFHRRFSSVGQLNDRSWRSREPFPSTAGASHMTLEDTRATIVGVATGIAPTVDDDVVKTLKEAPHRRRRGLVTPPRDAKTTVLS